MIRQIKSAFREHLAQLDWMDRHTLKLAMEKADAITDMIGFPDFILNEKKLNKRYEAVSRETLGQATESDVFLFAF